MRRFVFDSFAVLTYFYGQRGANKIERLLASLKGSKSHGAWLNLVNLGEIYYIIARSEGTEQADKVIALLKEWPILIVDPTEKLTLLAARIKASHRLSYADAFVVATALEKQAGILTGDPEFKQVEKMVKIEWL